VANRRIRAHTSRHISTPERGDFSDCKSGKMVVYNRTHALALDIGVVLGGSRGVHSKQGTHIGKVGTGMGGYGRTRRLSPPFYIITRVHTTKF